jgi:hypothetical protein
MDTVAVKILTNGKIVALRQFPLGVISRQFGRASAPIIPHRVQTVRGRKARDKHRFYQYSFKVAQLARDREQVDTEVAHVAKVSRGPGVEGVRASCEQE